MNFYLLIVFIFSYVSLSNAKGGGAKCSVCPQCMVCNPLLGCQYSNFGICKNTLGKNGYCYYGNCNTNIIVPKVALPLCKTYEIGFNNTLKLVNDINGLDCSTFGSIFKSSCISGICTPFVDGFDLLGNNVGCKLSSNGIMCDTNGVFTDGEVCMNGLCTMPLNPQKKCLI